MTCSPTGLRFSTKPMGLPPSAPCVTAALLLFLLRPTDGLFVAVGAVDQCNDFNEETSYLQPLRQANNSGRCVAVFVAAVAVTSPYSPLNGNDAGRGSSSSALSLASSCRPIPGPASSLPYSTWSIRSSGAVRIAKPCYRRTCVASSSLALDRERVWSPRHDARHGGHQRLLRVHSKLQFLLR